MTNKVDSLKRDKGNYDCIMTKRSRVLKLFILHAPSLIITHSVSSICPSYSLLLRREQ